MVARARLRGEAALCCRSGNFRNPRGWVCTGSLTGDLGLSSPGSGRGMTSPDQAFIGRRGRQVGAAWPGSPQAARRGLGRTDPHDPPPGDHPWEQCGRGGVRTPEVRVEKACSGVPPGVRPSERPSTPEQWARAPTARSLRGRPAGAGKRRGVRARTRRCGMLRGACGRAHVDSGAQRPAAPRSAPACGRRSATARGWRPRVFSGPGGVHEVRPNPETFPAPGRAVPALQAGRPPAHPPRGNRPPQARGPALRPLSACARRPPDGAKGSRFGPRRLVWGLGVLRLTSHSLFSPFPLSALRSSGTPNYPA